MKETAIDSRSAREPRPLRRPALLGSLTLTLGLGLPLALAQDDPAPRSVSASVEDARATQARWVDVRRVISKEKQDWALGKETLLQRIELVKDEINTLRGRIDETEKNITETDTKRTRLEEESAQMKSAAEVLATTLRELEQHTLAILSRLPEPLRERVRTYSQRIPEQADTARQSLSERFQNVVAVLNEANKFNRDITVTSEVRNLPDGTRAEVAALYIGLGQAYYVTANASAAGIGTATSEGWTWRPASEIAAEVAEAIAIFENEAEARFVPLPVQLPTRSQ